MTEKGRIRKLRKEARASGAPLEGELAIHKERGDQPVEFTEGSRGLRARERWAERYDALNGAPEGDWDR